MLVIWRQVSNGNCLFCNITDIIWTQKRQILLSHTILLCLLTLFVWRLGGCRRDPQGWVISVFRQQLPIEVRQRRGRHHCDSIDLPNRLICKLTPLSQSMTWGEWLDFDLRINLDVDLCQSKSISFNAALYLDYDCACILALWPLLAEAMSQKPKPDLWLIDLTSEVTGWPETLNVGTNRCLS